MYGSPHGIREWTSKWIWEARKYQDTWSGEGYFTWMLLYNCLPHYIHLCQRIVWQQLCNCLPYINTHFIFFKAQGIIFPGMHSLFMFTVGKTQHMTWTNIKLKRTHYNYPPPIKINMYMTLNKLQLALVATESNIKSYCIYCSNIQGRTSYNSFDKL